MSDTPNIDKRQAAIEVALKYAMRHECDRPKPKRHSLLGELIMFIHELYPDKPKDNINKS